MLLHFNLYRSIKRAFNIHLRAHIAQRHRFDMHFILASFAFHSFSLKCSHFTLCRLFLDNFFLCQLMTAPIIVVCNSTFIIKQQNKAKKLFSSCANVNLMSLESRSHVIMTSLCDQWLPFVARSTLMWLRAPRHRANFNCSLNFNVSQRCHSRKRRENNWFQGFLLPLSSGGELSESWSGKELEKLLNVIF